MTIADNIIAELDKYIMDRGEEGIFSEDIPYEVMVDIVRTNLEGVNNPQD